MGATNSKVFGTTGDEAKTNMVTALTDAPVRGCDVDSFLTSQDAADPASCEILAKANPDAVAFTLSSGKCNMFGASCFSGERPVYDGTLYVIHDRTPAYDAQVAEHKSKDYSVTSGKLTPGIIFTVIDQNKDGLLDEDEALAFSQTLGNYANTGWRFKGGLLTRSEVETAMATPNLDCREPKGYIDFGEFSDGLADKHTLTQCTKPDAGSTVQPVTYVRENLMFYFLGFDKPVCPAAEFPTPPPAPPPSPCPPPPDQTEVSCGPYEESFAPVSQSIPPETISAEVEATYFDCLKSCCSATVDGTECFGVEYTIATGVCKLFKAKPVLLYGTTDKDAYTAITAVTLKNPTESLTGRRALESTATLLEAPAAAAAPFQPSYRQLSTSMDTPMVTSEPAGLSPATLSIGLAVAPLAAFFVGVLGGKLFGNKRGAPAQQ